MQDIVLNSDELDFRTKEAFKTLRTNIEFSGSDVRVFCLTSCTPNEGKSNTAFELARSFAENGKKVLLVDGDLRKSVMRQRYRKGRVRFGLSNYLIGKAPFDEVICLTNVKNLYMIFSGPIPPNPSELLGNYRFQEMIEEARNTFDYVIIDTPPLGSVIDAAVVAKHCDGAILVIESATISRRFARKVKEQMEVTNCKILGVVLNKVDLVGKGYYGKYYGRYYGKYYGKYYGNYGNEE